MRAIIIGAGKVGFEIAKKLTEEGHDVVVVDRDEAVLREVEDNLDVLTIHGNGASTRVLEEASIKDASLFIAVTHIDEINIIACMIAKKLGVKTTIARIRNPEYQGLKNWTLSNKQLGIDSVINPEEAVAYEIIKFLRAPAATDIEYFADGKIQMMGFSVQEGAPIANKTIKEAHIAFCTVGAILRDGEVLIPRGSTRIRPGDDIFIIGKSGVPTEVGWLVGKSDQVTKNVVILGGGRTGFILAQYLEKHRKYGPFVKLIERDKEVCEELAERLHHVLVVNGDGTKADFFREENVRAADSFIAVTGQEQTNLLAGFMAKDLGVRRVIAELHREDYVPMARKMGIDVTVIPRIIIASTILRSIPKPNVMSLSLLKEGNLEVVEMIVSQGCNACSKPLRYIGLPEEVVVGAIVRGDAVVVPRGDTVMCPGDHVLIFAAPTVVPLLEVCFRVK